VRRVISNYVRVSLLYPPFFSPFLFSCWVENYGSVLRDCAAVISLDPHASKAYYRAGLALLTLDRAEEALDVCTRAGDSAAHDAGFKALRERAENKCAEQRRKAEERAERARHASEEKRKMDAAFTVRVYSPAAVPARFTCTPPSGTQPDQYAEPGRLS
jgi:tetratricopeptide (TPR) repeat protein